MITAHFHGNGGVNMLIRLSGCLPMCVCAGWQVCVCVCVCRVGGWQVCVCAVGGWRV